MTWKIDPVGKARRLISVDYSSRQRYILGTAMGFHSLRVSNDDKGDHSMTKAELVSIVAKQCNMTKKVADAVLKSLTGAIHESLKNNGEIRISDLGMFWVLEKKAMIGVHPRTLAKINVPAMKSPRFRAAKALREVVKGPDKQAEQKSHKKKK